MISKYSIFPPVGIVVAASLLNACKPPTPVATPASPRDIQHRISNSTAPLTMVHVWATWCDPCREEFPELVKIMGEFQTLEVILISADDPAASESVEAFLVEHQSPASSLITTQLNQEFIESLSPTWGGALPATFFFKQGSLVSEWEGKRTAEEYRETINPILKE